jgi:trk system potassium uptake protein TrkA
MPRNNTYPTSQWANNHPEIVDKPLRELSFPEGALIGAIVHDGEVQIATGDTVLQPGDELLVITLPQAIGRVEGLLA